MRSFAAPLGLGVTPPTTSTACVPPRPIIAPDTVFLVADETNREGSADGANGANCGKREDSYSGYAKQPVAALPGLGVTTPARSGVCEHMRPATTSETSLRDKHARRVGSEVGTGVVHDVGPEGESFSCAKCLSTLLRDAGPTPATYASADTHAQPGTVPDEVACGKTSLRGAVLPSTRKTLETSEPIGEPGGEEGHDQKGYQRSRVMARRARDARARGRHRARLLPCPSDIEVPPQVNGPFHGDAAASSRRATCFFGRFAFRSTAADPSAS